MGMIPKHERLLRIVNLGQGVFGDRLKGLLHIDCLLGGGLEVGDLVLGVAPLLCTLG